MHVTRMGLVVLLFAASAGVASGQQDPNPPPEARVQIGPLYLNPRINLKELGVDSNVFNEAVPRRDYTATISPELEAVLWTRAVRLTVHNTTDYVYYHRYKDERMVNGGLSTQVEGFLGVLHAVAGYDVANTRERPNMEIDARARRRGATVRLGADVRIGTRTYLGAGVRREEIDFDGGVLFRGVELERTLDRVSDAASAFVRFSLTDLTALSFTTEIQQDRFDFNSARDTDSLGGGMAFDFRPGSAFQGRASLGYRRFRTSDGSADYSGAVSSVTLIYRPRESTRVHVDFDRGLSYSFEEVEPRYVAAGGSVQLVQQIVGPLDLLLRGGYRQLEYRALDFSDTDRGRDRQMFGGGGFGFHVTEELRIGLNAEYLERRSDRDGTRNYDRVRVYTSAVYGF